MITIHDNDYNIVRANKAGKALLKLPALEKHLQTKCFSFYHGTDAPPAGCPSCDCLKSGMPGVFESFEPYLTRYLEIRAIPRFDSHNQRAGLIHIVRDITERKRVEAQREAAVEALQVSEKKLNEAQVLGQIGNWEYDIKNQKLTWSDQVYKLYERDPVLGPPTTEEEAAYYSPEQAQTLRGYIRIAIETGQFFEYDLQATLPSGKHVYLAARLRPIKDAQGRVIKLFGIVQDITERKQAEIKNSLAKKEILL